MLKKFLWAVSIILILFSTVYIIKFPTNQGSYFPAILGFGILIFDYLRTRRGESKLYSRAYFVVKCGFIYFLITFSIFCFIVIKNKSIRSDEDFDAIIVLGAGLKNGNTVTGTLAYRLDKAYELYEFNNVPIVVSGGQGADELVSEASVMKEYLVELGAPESDIILEDLSTSTQENFEFSKIKLDDIFTEEYNIVFTTSDFHIFRASKYMEKSGLEGYGVGSKSVANLIPSNYLREYVAIHAYYIFGGGI